MKCAVCGEERRHYEIHITAHEGICVDCYRDAPARMHDGAAEMVSSVIERVRKHRRVDRESGFRDAAG